MLFFSIKLYFLIPPYCNTVKLQAKRSFGTVIERFYFFKPKNCTFKMKKTTIGATGPSPSFSKKYLYWIDTSLVLQNIEQGKICPKGTLSVELHYRPSLQGEFSKNIVQALETQVSWAAGKIWKNGVYLKFAHQNKRVLWVFFCLDGYGWPQDLH